MAAADTSISFLSARGTYYRVQISSQAGPGIYAIDELTKEAGLDYVAELNQNSTDSGDTALSALLAHMANVTSQTLSAPILLTGVDIQQNDVVSRMPCLNNIKVFYSFGQNFGDISVSGEAFLGSLGNLNLEGYNLLVRFFRTYRVSNYLLPINISVAKNPYQFYLTGMKIGQIDPDMHILPFVFIGTLLDLNGGTGNNKINPNGVVLTGDLLSSSDALSKALSVRNKIPASFSETPTTTPTNTSETLTTDFIKNTTVNGESPKVQPTNAQAGMLQKTLTGVGLSDNERALLLQNQGLSKNNVSNTTMSESAETLANRIENKNNTLVPLPGSNQTFAVPVSGSNVNSLPQVPIKTIAPLPAPLTTIGTDKPLERLQFPTTDNP